MKYWYNLSNLSLSSISLLTNKIKRLVKKTTRRDAHVLKSFLFYNIFSTAEKHLLIRNSIINKEEFRVIVVLLFFNKNRKEVQTPKWNKTYFIVVVNIWPTFEQSSETKYLSYFLLLISWIKILFSKSKSNSRIWSMFYLQLLIYSLFSKVWLLFLGISLSSSKNTRRIKQNN